MYIFKNLKKSRKNIMYNNTKFIYVYIKNAKKGTKSEEKPENPSHVSLSPALAAPPGFPQPRARHVSIRARGGARGRPPNSGPVCTATTRAEHVLLALGRGHSPYFWSSRLLIAGPYDAGGRLCYCRAHGPYDRTNICHD